MFWSSGFWLRAQTDSLVLEQATKNKNTIFIGLRQIETRPTGFKKTNELRTHIFPESLDSLYESKKLNE